MTVVYVLVGREQLASALAFNSMVFNSSRFFGPAVGGAVMAAAGTGWTFATAAALMFLFSLFLQIIRIGPLPPRERPTESIITDAVAGVRYALTHTGIRRQLIILVLIALFARPVTDLLPGFVANIFERGPDGLALLLICHSIGAMAGGVWLTSRSAGVAGLSRVMIVSILFMSGVLLLFSMTSVFWIGCALVGLLGLCFNIQAISNQTLIQYAVDPALRGRVASVYGLIARGGPAVGALLMGAAADHLGLSVPLGFGAALCLVLWLWAWGQRRTMAAALEGDPAGAQDVAAPARVVVATDRVP
jgi:predicted MFS family arabinose efflux permease